MLSSCLKLNSTFATVMLVVAILASVLVGSQGRRVAAVPVRRDVCQVYNDPYVRRFHSPVTERLNLSPGYHRLLENNVCPHQISYSVYALIGSPYSYWSYYSSVAVVVEFEGRKFWLTRNMQVFDSHAPPPALPTTIQHGGTTVKIARYGNSYWYDYLRLVIGSAVTPGLEVRMYRQNGWGRIHVYATVEFQICGIGLCKLQGIGQLGFTFMGKSDNARVSAGKQAELAAMARKFKIGQTKENMESRIPTAVSKSRMLNLLPEAKKRLAFVLDENGPFKECHGVENWHPQDQYKVAYETAAEMGMNNDALKMAITAIAENCNAISGGTATANVEEALQLATGRK